MHLLTYLHGFFKEPIIGPPKSKMAEIRHLENGHDVTFSAEGGPIWIKFRRLVQNDMSTVVIWSKSKPDEFQYGEHLGEFHGMSSQSHVSHCRVLPLGEFTVTIPEPNATLQDVIIPCAILKIIFRHILFDFFDFLNAVWALTSGGFRIVSDTLVLCQKSISFASVLCSLSGLAIFHSKKIFLPGQFSHGKKTFFLMKKTQFFHQFEKTCQPCSLNLMRFRLSCSSSASILIFSTAHHLNCLNTTKNPTFTLTHTWTHVLLNTGRWGLQEVSVQLKSISKSHSTSL